MPDCCGEPVVHPWKFRPPLAVGELWLAVTFQLACCTSGTGRDASSSTWVHGAFRSPVARTRATSAGVTIEPVLPKLLRTYDAAAATHSSLFVPIGTITSVKL